MSSPNPPPNERFEDNHPFQKAWLKIKDMVADLICALLFLGHRGWYAKKQFQIFLRQYLSLLIAFVMCFLVIVREIWDFLPWHPFEGIYVLKILILVAIFGSLSALIWEKWGNKLSTSPQELAFATGIRVLLEELEKFLYGEDKNRETDTEKRLAAFIDTFLDISSKTLCGNKKVDGCLMKFDKKRNEFFLYAMTPDADYDPGMTLPPFEKAELKTEGANLVHTSGPAGVSYGMGKVFYMPFRHFKIGFPFLLVRPSSSDPKFRYRWGVSYKGWKSYPNHEKFMSVLCFPIATYKEEHPDEEIEKNKHAVVCYSTKSWDPFVDRDFIMGESFASILAQAWAAAHVEATK